LIGAALLDLAVIDIALSVFCTGYFTVCCNYCLLLARVLKMALLIRNLPETVLVALIVTMQSAKESQLDNFAHFSV
jgi:hypothetical protein